MEPSRKDIRFRRFNAPSLRSWGEPPAGPDTPVGENVVVDCGWGRLIFAHTFRDPADVARILREETPEERDIALYLRDPHVVLSLAPQELFLDPSHTYRLWLSLWRPMSTPPKGFVIRRAHSRSDAEQINHLYGLRHMVPVDPGFMWRHRNSRVLTYLVAEDSNTGDIIGTVTGVDHAQAFSDPENGSSLWALAVAPQAAHPGVGSALVIQLAGHYLARGRAFMDLSVLHNNHEAIALYEKLGFRRVPVFCIKHKNPVNEPLFMGPTPDEELNPYARIIVDEARRRGIAVEVIDAEYGYFTLTFGGRTVNCRESLTELTSAIAMWRCDDKVVTHRCLARAGLRVPRQQLAGTPEDNAAFLEQCGRVVVKPARGEQGRGISVNLATPENVEKAVASARPTCERVLMEELCQGDDLRIIVIGFEVVAAAVRRPPEIVGNGHHTVRELIDKQSRRRAAATGGESRIPLDDETVRCVAEAGYDMDSVLPTQEQLGVRKAANLHTGGTIHDVTDRLHPTLREAAETAARALDIPVTGLDFMVPAVDGPDYVIIEANERPGLANHEPQPTAERFIDLLFPQTTTAPLRAP
jgi:GNAT-family acetyltransferase (TIGR03103 family)